MHIKVFVNNEFMFPFHMCYRSLWLQQTGHLVLQEVNLNHHQILERVKSCVFILCTFCWLNLHSRFLQLSCLGWLMFFRNTLGTFPLLVCIFSYKEIHNIVHPNSMHIYTLSTPRISEIIYCYSFISLNIILDIFRRRGHSWYCGCVCRNTRGWVVEVEDPLFSSGGSWIQTCLGHH